MKICRTEKKSEVVDIEYKVCDSYCCRKMEQWLDIRTYSGRKNLNYKIGTGRFTICVREAYDHYCSSDGDDKVAYEELDYCPFCGHKLQEPETVIETPKKKRLLRKKK